MARDRHRDIRMFQFEPLSLVFRELPSQTNGLLTSINPG